MARPDDYVEMSATYFFDAMKWATRDEKTFSWSEGHNRLYGESRFLEILEDSKKFCFGSFRRFNIGDPDQNFRKNAIHLAETGEDFLKNQIIIAPYPRLWLEWDFDEHDKKSDIWKKRSAKLCCLVTQSKELMSFQRISNYHGCTTSSMSEEWTMSKVALLISMTGEWRFVRLEDGSDKIPDDLDTGVAYAALASMAMLLARETKVVERRPPAGLNAHRVKKGKVPFFSHHVVTIDPQRIVYEGGDGSQPGGPKRTSPRLHWRRGHVRTLSSGKKIGIPPSIIGAKGGGGGPVIDKTYRVRTSHDTKSTAAGAEADQAGV